MKEARSTRFKRLAQARVNKIIKMVRLLGNLSVTTIYAYEPDQIVQIFTAIQDELNKALDAAFAERDDLTIKFFCHCAGITKYAALKYLNSLCEGEQPSLRRVQLGRTYVYKRLS